MSSNQRSKRNVLSVDVRSPSTSPSVIGSDIAGVIESKLGELKEYFKVELKKHEERIMERVGGLSAEFSNLRADIKSLADKYKTLSQRCNNYDEEINENRLLLSSIENNLVAADVIINNVPDSVELDSVIDKISNALAISQLKVTKVFRTQSKDQKGSRPFIAKLSSPDDRVLLFRSLADFRKGKKRQLQLVDIGIDSNKSINISECLSTYNRQLLNTALDYKRKKMISTAFSLRGHIYVRVRANDNAVRVRDLKTLIDVVGSCSIPK